MKCSKLIVLLSVLFLPVLSDAQTRSLEEQQAISHISQAEYYTRMALRSLEASEKIGKAPYFNYQSAREDIEKVLSEFKTYLTSDESADPPPAVPLIVDGRYFAASIKDFLATQKADTGQVPSNVQEKSNGTRSAPQKTTSKNVEAGRKKNIPDNEQRSLKQDSAIVLPPPALIPQNAKAKRDKIEEILKKGL
jgi:hypothetical protein